MNKHLDALREKMKQHNIDVYYVPSSDPHMSEYLPDHYKTRAFISGFTGSAGTVVVTMSQAGLWTDGRYFLQAEKQLQGSGVDLFKMGEKGVPTIYEFLHKEVKKGSKVGMNGKVISVAELEGMKASNPHLEFITDVDLVGEVWADRPALCTDPAFILDIKYAGQSAKEKINLVRQKLEALEADSTVIGSLEDVCYLFNVRCNDVECTPVLVSYAIIDKTRAILFVDTKKIPSDVKSNLEKEGVAIMEYEDVFVEAEKLTGTIYLDPGRTNVYLKNKVKGNIIKGTNITTGMKACKNAVEIENFRKSMVIDGVAMVRIIKWITEKAGSGITEYDVLEQLFKFRSEGEGFVEESFGTIAGYGPNGAIVHYAPQKESAAKVEAKSFLLLDSGGHYYTGTTDITRTIPVGPLTQEEKENYTYVLKSHISLAKAKFKAGVDGYALDTFARKPLWEAGKDYNHGTGHGVGYLLSVHEGPHQISQRKNLYPMQLGMITSNEPGMYITNKHGIRIENLVLTKLCETTEFGDFYDFETLTICPISTKPVIKDLLTADEVDWLNSYNSWVREKLVDLVPTNLKEFLYAETEAI